MDPDEDDLTAIRSISPNWIGCVAAATMTLGDLVGDAVKRPADIRAAHDLGQLLSFPASRDRI
jgi:hypothetical protein